MNERDQLAYDLAKLDGGEWVFEPPIMDGIIREGPAPEFWRRRADALIAAGWVKGREEWGVRREGFVRRIVTDWEAADG